MSKQQEQAAERLRQQKAKLKAELEARNEAARQKFLKQQEDVARTKEEQLQARLKKHQEFDDHYDAVATNRKNFLATRSGNAKADSQRRFGLNSTNKKTQAEKQDESRFLSVLPHYD